MQHITFSKLKYRDFKGRDINPFLVVPPEMLSKYAHRFRAITRPLIKVFPSVKYVLISLGYKKIDEYIFASIITSFFISFFLSFLFYILALQMEIDGPFLKSFLVFLLSSLMAFIFLSYYPSLKAKSFADEIDRNLLFALKDMLVEIKSGVTLYDVLVNIAHSDYGLVSREIALAVKDVSAGKPLTAALENVAATTQSEHLRRVLWQIITASRSGASLEPALESAINMVSAEQIDKMKKFVANLNFIVLIYMLCSSSIPAMILPFLMVLICFISIDVSTSLLTNVFLFFIFAQLIVIGFVYSSRPRQ